MAFIHLPKRGYTFGYIPKSDMQFILKKVVLFSFWDTHPEVIQ